MTRLTPAGVLLGLALGLSACVVEQPVNPYPAPPPPQAENPPPPPPGQVVIWEPGQYRWANGAYVWVPGHYVARVATMNRWVPAHWENRGGTWVWVGGHWA
jgi:hypothetical protein